MRIKFSIAEYEVTQDKAYYCNIDESERSFTSLTIGRDSYIEEAMADVVFDEKILYNLQIGRYSSLANNIQFIIDLNHDYMKVCQGRIGGVPYKRPEFIKRKGQIIIMNDCWIGENVTILSGVTIGNGAVVSAGTVVARDVPDYAIVAGNPAKIIGYRFNENQIRALNKIRWWNWKADKVRQSADLLYGDVDRFIEANLNSAEAELKSIPHTDIMPIEKRGIGDEKIYLYIPDFEQEYPTYPSVIDAFVKSYAGTNYELLIYVREDELFERKINLLDSIFELYGDIECYINIFGGNVEDERSLFSQVDAYITNRSVDNILHVDMARLYGVKVISSVDMPIFEEKIIKKMTKTENDENTSGVQLAKVTEYISSLVKVQKDVNNRIDECINAINNNSNKIYQLSVNQVAMNSTFDNFRYELLACKNDISYPKIESAEIAIEKIIEENKSMCRFGDGEFAVIMGISRQKFQHADEKLAMRLKEVLSSHKDNILICIADIYGDLSKYTTDGIYNIRAYLTPETRAEHYKLLDMQREYYDAYMTRPYAIYKDNMTEAPRNRFAHLKRIWKDRSLLIIEGEKTRMGVGNDLFDGANDIIRILGPAENAYDKYDEILYEARKYAKDRLVLIAMGMTATVLAYDLACEGYQALDIGHIDLEYEWMLQGKGGKTPIKTKYNNEVAGGNIVEDISNPLYESQIIARIY